MKYASTSCVCMLIGLMICMSIGGFCFDYVLYTTVGKDIPWYGDCVCGAIAPMSVTAAVICWVLKSCNIETPFFCEASKTQDAIR